MPIIKTYGERIAPGSVGPRQVPAIPASKAASPPINGTRWARNGKHPNAHLISQLNEACSQAALFRSKQVFSSIGRLSTAIGTVGASDRKRWRFAFHTGVYTTALMAVVVMVPTDIDLDPIRGYNSGGRLDIFTGTTESSLVGSMTFNYGAHPTGSNTTIGFQNIKVLTQYLDVSPDTDYTGRFCDTNYGRLVSACVFELSSLTENFSGYPSTSITAQSPILDRDREMQATLLRNLWRRGGATVLNWTVDDPDATVTSGPVVRTASVTECNIFDTSITAVSSSSPGYTLDMRNRTRLSQSGVPCKMVAFGKMSAGTNGTVILKDSGGSAVATISSAFTTTASWKEVSFTMPATLSKYDLHIKGPAAGTFSLYACSIFPYET